MTPTPAGWYPDPSEAARLRFWDGEVWTEQTRPGQPDAVGMPQPAPGPWTAAPSGPAATVVGHTGTDEVTSRPGYASTSALDVIGVSSERPRGIRRSLVVAGAGVAVLVAAGGAYAFAALSGGGAQPEDALPGTAIGYAEIDLDPSAGQKVAAFNLARKFPSVEVSSQDSLVDDLFEEVFGDALPEGLTYADDVQPWIGARAGVAVLSELDEAGEPQVAVAVQYGDRDAAQAGLARIAEAAATGEDAFAFAFGVEGYVVLAQTQQIVDGVVRDAQAGSLSDNGTYRAALEALGGDQIATTWLDLGGLYRVVPAEAREEFARSGLFAPDVEPSGSFIAGLSAGSDHLQVVGRAVDVATGLQEESTIGKATGSELIRAMPSDTFGAVSVNGLGAAVTRLYEQALEQAEILGEDLTTNGLGFDVLGILPQLEAESGLELPEDIQAVLGDELVAAAFPPAGAGADAGLDPEFAVRVRGGDVQRVLEMEQTLGTGPAGLVQDVDGDLVAGSTPEAIERVRGDGGLGDSDVFRNAVPDAEAAGFVLFLDVPALLNALAGQGELIDPEDQADLDPLQAVGMTAVGGDDGGFTLRITVR